MSALATKEPIREIIKQRVIAKSSDGRRIANSRTGMPDAWLMDFRATLLDADFLDSVAELFWETYAHKYPFQVGGQETAAISLITAIALKGRDRNTPVSAFYIRKSRKAEGLQKIIEGSITDEPVILVDDLINSGNTFVRQIETLKRENKKVSDIFTIVRFRDVATYTSLTSDGIQITSLFTLSEFGLSLSAQQKHINLEQFTVKWSVHGSQPNYFYRIPKSAPAVDDNNIYVGWDDGIMHAFSQTTGDEIWKYKILGFGVQGKTIFSSPALHNDTVYFGAYDGNFYALDAASGKKKWMYMDADWIGSSPCIAKDLGLVYVGLEYGLFKRKGGVVALNAITGKPVWECIDMPEYTHASPAYSQRFNAVAIGSNDGVMYFFRATDGKLLWKQPTHGEIKASVAFDEQRGYVVFGSFDGSIHILRVGDGSEVYQYETGIAFYSTPCIYENHAYIGGLDKRFYCVDLDTLQLTWKFDTAGRIFSSPTVVNNRLYVGSNDGRLYELDPHTGTCTAIFQTTERITNKIAYNATTGRLFVPTYANEIYCVERSHV